MENESFTVFAQVYDMYMDGIPYDEWYAYLLSLLKEYGVNEGLVVDLGCGTGNMTERLASAGYDMIGIDASEEMLSIAMDKRIANKSNTLYICQDMTEMELYGTVAAIVSVGDSMNYIISEASLKKVFLRVNNYLDEDGVFLFDLKTDYYFRNELGDKTFVEQKETGTLIWENHYCDTKMLHKYGLTIYTQIKGTEGRYERWEERQFQKAYPLDTVKDLLKEAGMEFVAAYEAFTREPPSECGNRIYIVARKGILRF